VENIPAVIDQGYTMDKTHYYLLLDYINGDNGMLCISKYSSEEQYRLGYQMGETISEIHGLSESKIYPDKSNAYRYKINKYIEYYESHKFQFAFLNGIEEVLEEFVLQISTRPMIMLHNDFHLGNMVINGDKVSLIDFNRACLGDNIREFDCVAWTVTHSIPFAVGIFDAYLRDKDINSFFKFWRGYLAIWQIQMLYFIDGQDDEEKKIVLDLIQLSNSWFDKSATIPNWYLDNSKIIK
jgi:aminoglycoside phosphotransferase (APT) family kinase protein